MSRTKSQYARILKLDRLIREGAYPNCTSFASQWEVSSKTVQRDMEYLRDQLGAPLEYSRERRGYYYTHLNWQMPAMNLSEGELLALLISTQAAQLFDGAPIAEELQRISDKIQSALPDKVTLGQEQLNGQLTFVQSTIRPVSPEAWLAFMQGLSQAYEVCVSHTDALTRETIKEQVQPLHVANIKGDWYVFVRRPDTDEIVQIALFRCTKAETTSKVFIPGNTDALKKSIEGSFGRCVFCNGEPVYAMKLHFVAELRHIIEERQWGMKQQIEVLADGSLILSFESPSLMEVFWWVLEWGWGVRVLEPPEMRELHIREIEKMTRLYINENADVPFAEEAVNRLHWKTERQI